jgi:hypothetical protein
MSTKKLLQNAIDFLIELWGEQDTFCETLVKIPKEEKICEKNCDNVNAECVKRFLKYYKKS